MSDKLLPCPFCGTSNFVYIDECEDGHVVGCFAKMEGGCAILGEGFISEEFAIGAWNKRVREDELKAHIKTLVDALECAQPYVNAMKINIVADLVKVTNLVKQALASLPKELRNL